MFGSVEDEIVSWNAAPAGRSSSYLPVHRKKAHKDDLTDSRWFDARPHLGSNYDLDGLAGVNGRKVLELAGLDMVTENKRRINGMDK